MISLNYRDHAPLYEQVKEGFIRLIVTGALSPGDQLPSVRELASELSINPNTIQSAYRELEAENYIYKVAGKGCFVSGDRLIAERDREDCLRVFEKSAAKLLYGGVPVSVLRDRLDSIQKEVAADDQD